MAVSKQPLASTSVKADALALSLAHKILRPELSDMSPRVATWIKMAVADTVGCILAGVKEESVAMLMSVDGVAAAHGNSLIFGTDKRTSALDAALVNGLAAHALDYDDVLDVCVIHATAVVLPALFALGEDKGSSGRDLMVAYVAGVELGVRLSQATSPQHRRNGWHPTATLGAFCAVGAAARLLRLSPDQVACAIGLVASQAAGIQANFGTMTKPFHAGQAARAGVLAALMAEKGFTANHYALEDTLGFMNIYAHGGPVKIDAMLAEFASPFDLDIGAILKEYPCCALTHNIAGLMLELRQQHSLSAHNVKQVELLCHPQAFGSLDRPMPMTGLDAKFSNQYVAARALNDGALRLDHFDDAATQQSEVRATLAKIQMKAHPNLEAGNPHHTAAEVVVHMATGERIAKFSQKPNFRSFANPMSEAQLSDKFYDCAARALPHARIAPLFEMLMSLDTQPTLAALGQHLTVQASG